MITFLKKLREKHNYSQEELAKKIGVSRQTFSQIEKGNVEMTVSQAKKLADIFGLFLDDFLAERENKEPKVVLEKKSSKESKKITDLRISIPQENLEKFKEVLIYILEKVGAKPNVGEGVLCKLLYFIDFDFYEKHEKQLIGATYIKNHHGPTPAMFPQVVTKMEQDNELTRITKKHFQYQQKKYLPLRRANLSILTAQEIEHIDWVIARFSDKNAKEMEEYSHLDVPWITAENLKPIEYEAVFYRTPEFSVRKYENEL